MKIGYIASHMYRHTFEINEVQELLRQRPESRVYSFYRAKGSELQRERIAQIPVEITSWSPGAVLRGAVYLKLRHPIGFARSALALLARSLPNPVYWAKNAAVFCIAMPILADARRHGVTHLHANFGSSPATIAWLGKKMLGLEMSVTYHAFDIYSTAMSSRDPLKQAKLRDAELVVSVHEDGRAHLRALVPDVAADKFKVIRISVDFEAMDKQPAKSEPPLVLAAGNLVPPKGFETLIEAVGLLKRHGVPVRLRILGEGPERPRLESLVRELGIRDRVELPGYYQHQKLAEHLAEAALFVMPSRVTPEGLHDGMPTVVVEAWLAHTPVIASLVGGMAEVIIEGETGLVFRPGDVEGLAERIQGLLGSDTMRRDLARDGYNLAKKEFSPERNVAKLIAAITE